MPNPIIYDITPKPNDQGDQITIHGSHFIQPNYNYVTPVSAWWPLDGNLNDSTGNGHTLTAVGFICCSTMDRVCIIILF